MKTKFLQKNWDYWFLGAVVSLTVLGLITIFSVSLDVDGSILWDDRLRKQLIYLVIGIVSFVLLSLVDFNIFKSIIFAGGGYVASLFMLVLSLFSPAINYVHRWIRIGGIVLQPSEIAKLFLILAIAWVYASNREENMYIKALKSFLLTLPMVIVIFLQPHGSMSIFFVTLVFLLNFLVLPGIIKHFTLISVFLAGFSGVILLYNHMFVWGSILLSAAFLVTVFLFFSEKIDWGKLLALIFVVSVVTGAIASLLFPIVWNDILHPYQRQRIETFLHPEEASRDEVLNYEQSIVAVGSGRILGKGWGSGTQSKLRFLPEYNTDFIFASFAEQFGLVGVIFMLGSFFTLMLVILKYVYIGQDDIFISVFLLGLIIKFTLEVFISVGTNIGLIPVTGLPLPFFSFGGTITVMTFIALGIAHSMILYLNEDNLAKYDGELLTDVRNVY